jgi:hypothetical protein
VSALSYPSPPSEAPVFELCMFQTDGSMALDSDEGEEPSPEAMARYLSMRRHTVGVPDPR